MVGSIALIPDPAAVPSQYNPGATRVQRSSTLLVATRIERLVASAEVVSFGRGNVCEGGAARYCVNHAKSILTARPSMSDGPLQPAHDAFAEVSCDVDRRH